MPSPYFLLDPNTGRLRFTASGREALGERFARAGINLQQITTLEHARMAAATVTHQEMQHLAADLKGCDPQLDEAMTGLPEWAD